MRALVTGGAGFIGSHLVERLLADGHEVVVLDDLSAGSLDNLPSHQRLTFVEGDIRDADRCAAACKGVTNVLHQAARNSVPRSIAHPQAALEVNVTGSFNLLRAAVDAGAKRFIYASSSSVYGADPRLPKQESHAPAAMSPYAATKAAVEQLARSWWHAYGLPTVGLRYFNVFGPRQDPAGAYAAVVPRFVVAALQGEPATIYGDGESGRDFTFVDNVVAANLRALEAPASCFGQVYNVALGQRITVSQLHRAIGEAAGHYLPAQHTPPRRGDVRNSLADPSAAMSALGFLPEVAFEEGIQRTVAWYRKHWRQR